MPTPKDWKWLKEVEDNPNSCPARIVFAKLRAAWEREEALANGFSTKCVEMKSVMDESASWLETRTDYTEGNAATASNIRGMLAGDNPSGGIGRSAPPQGVVQEQPSSVYEVGSQNLLITPQLLEKQKAPAYVSTGAMVEQPAWEVGQMLVKGNLPTVKVLSVFPGRTYKCIEWRDGSWDEVHDMALPLDDYVPWPRVGDWVSWPGASHGPYQVIRLEGDKAWLKDASWIDIYEPALEPASPPASTQPILDRLLRAEALIVKWRAQDDRVGIKTWCADELEQALAVKEEPHANG